MRGRKPVPTQILKMRGSSKAGRRGPEPEPVEAPIETPAHLDETARKEWQRVLPILQAMRVMSAGDMAALASYCVQWSRHVAAEMQIAEMGVLVQGPTGAAMANPMVAVSNNAHDRVMKDAAELGLTPSARSRVHPLPSTTGLRDSKAKFFQQARG